MKNKKIIVLSFLVFGLLFCFSFPKVRAATVEELQNMITQLQQQIAQLRQQLSRTQKETGEVILKPESQPAVEEFETLTMNLRYGDRGEQVKELQEMLKQDLGIYPEGIVSGYFGPLTQVAVIRFQERYADEILEPLGLTSGTGFVGRSTRKKLSELYGGQFTETQQKVEQEVTILSGKRAGTYLTKETEAGIYETFEDIPEKPLKLIPEETELSEEPEYQGYIIQFKEKPLITKWQELQSKVERKIIIPVQESIQFNSYKSTLNSAFQAHKTQLRIKISGFDEKIKREFKHVFNGISLDISQEEAEEIKGLDYIKGVSPNYKVQALLMDSVPLIQADKVWDLGYTGQGVTIAVIDTGIDYTHPDLGGCLGNGCKVIGGYDFINNDLDPMDDHGHGTHCAGIAAGNGNLKGVAPDANLLAYKVLSNYGSGTFDQVIAGIEKAVDPNQDGDYSDHADVISLSLGCDNPMYCNQDDPTSLAVDEAAKAGVVVVVAAGNSGSKYETVGSPGSARKALTVGASCQPSQVGVHKYCDNKIATFSSRGPTAVGVKPDVVAPGVEICSSQWDAAWNDKKCFDDKHTSISGTSMATPHTAGAAALIKQAHSDWDPEEIKMSLRNTASDLGYDMYTQGYGRIDVLKAVQSEKPPVAAFYNPVKIYGESFNIKGTAIGDDFTLYYTKGENPEAKNWTEICNGLATVTDDTLCDWDLRYLEDGEYTLKLIVERGTEKSSEFGFINLDNIQITYPKDIRGETGWSSEQLRQVREVLPTWKDVEIEGTVVGFGFKNYTIKWCDENYGKCSSKGITLTNNGNYPINENILGKWDVSSLTNAGYHYLKLTVYFENKQEQIEDVKIYVDPTIHKGWPKKIDIIEEAEGFVLSLNGQPTLADIDNNGQEDIIIAYGKNIHVFSHDGSYINGWPRKITNPYNIWEGMMQTGPAVADLNGDGYNEIVVGDNAGYLHILNHNGTYLDGWPKKLSDSKYPYIGPVSIGDINGDGEFEIMFYDFSGYVYAVNINGNYLEGFPIYSGSSFPKESIGVADLNNDGYGELVTIFYNSVYLFDHKGNILDSWPKVLGKYIKFALGDINDDNEIEIVVGTLNGIYIYSWDSSVLDFVPIENLSYINGLSIGDIDKDGKLEIAMMANYGQGLHLLKKRNEGWQEADGFPIRNWTYRDGGFSSNYPLFGDLNTGIQNEISISVVDGENTVPAGKLPELFAYNSDGSIVRGFPIMLGQTVFGTGSPMSDIDGDGKNELMTYVRDGSLFVWDMNGKSENNEWPVFYHDSQHTNFYSKPSGLIEKSLKVTFPNGGVFRVTKSSRITWKQTGLDGKEVDILLAGYNKDGKQIDDWKTIQTNVPADREFIFWLPRVNDSVISSFSTLPDKYKIKIREVERPVQIQKTVEDVSDDYFTIDFGIASSITVLSPNGGEVWEVGKTYEIKWQSRGIEKVDIMIGCFNPADPRGGCFSEVGNDFIVKEVPASGGSYVWQIPQNFVSARFWQYGNYYKISVIEYQPNRVGVSDESDNYFSIVSPTTPYIQVISPSGGEQITTNEYLYINWEKHNWTGNKIDIFLGGYDNDGNQIDDWKKIITVSSGTAGFAWVPSQSNIFSTFSTLPIKYKIKLKEVLASTETRTAAEDISDGYFTVDFITSITITSPKGGEQITDNKYLQINWTKDNWTGNNMDIFIGGYDENGNQIDDWKKIITVSEKTAGFAWVPSQSNVFSTFSTLPIKYKIKLKEITSSNAVEDISDGYFTVDFVTSINIISPKGGDKWYIGDTHNITWEAKGEGLLNISIGPYSGGIRKIIAENVAASQGSYSWDVGSFPETSIEPADDYKIVIMNSTKLIGDWTEKFSIIRREQEEPVGLKSIENQLADISQAVSRLIERIKELLKNR